MNTIRKLSASILSFPIFSFLFFIAGIYSLMTEYFVLPGPIWLYLVLLIVFAIIELKYLNYDELLQTKIIITSILAVVVIGICAGFFIRAEIIESFKGFEIVEAIFISIIAGVYLLFNAGFLAILYSTTRKANEQ